MILSELFPGDSRLEIDPLTSPLKAVAHWYPRVWGTRFNYVISDIGKSNTSDEVSNELDRYVLRAIRASSDLIITTGHTARAEHLRASKLAPMAIITTHPDSLDIPATELESDRTIYICSSERPATDYPNSSTRWLHIPEGPISEVLQKIQEDLHPESLLLETGLSSTKELCSAGLVNEICLTVTEAVSLDSASSTAETFLKALGVSHETVQVLNNENTWFFRYLVDLKNL